MICPAAYQILVNGTLQTTSSEVSPGVWQISAGVCKHCDLEELFDESRSPPTEGVGSQLESRGHLTQGCILANNFST